MGKVEKIIVLSVLMLVTVILVVALNTSESPGALPGGDVRNGTALIAEAPEAVPSGRKMGAGRDELPEPRILFGDPAPVLPPLVDGSSGIDGPGASGDLEDPFVARPLDGPAASAPADDPALNPAQTPGLLSSHVVDEAIEEVPEQSAAPLAVGPQGSILVLLRGLEDSGLPDFKFYTCAEGETFRGLAARFYGDRRRAGLLKHANEGTAELEAGLKIWVPVYDLESPVKKGDDPGTGAATYYTVGDGDSLWTISKDKYGAGSRWKEIFEANRDLLKDENSLSLGMRLRIP